MEKELRGVPIDLPEDAYLNSNSKYDHLELALSEYGEDVENLLPAFREHLMTNKTLPTLCDEDLQLLGVENPRLRERMITNFQDQNIQRHTFDKMLQEMQQSKYNTKVLENVGDHLKDMSVTIGAATLQLNANADCEGASAYKCQTLRSLEQLEINLDEIEMIIEGISPSPESVFPYKLIIVTSLVGLFLSAFVAMKLRGR